MTDGDGSALDHVTSRSGAGGAPIPPFQRMMSPILCTLLDGETLYWREVAQRVSGLLDVAGTALELTNASGQGTFDNRVQWAISHLAQAGLLERPSRGHVRLTAAGREAQREGVAIDMAFLIHRYEAYREFRRRKRSVAGVGESGGPDAPTEEAAEGTPEDLINAALKDNQAEIESQLLARALTVTPSSFERLVLRLLKAMGYGSAFEGQHVGRSGDRGIDGIINQDRLGLDRVYVQAKQYARDRSVGSPVVREFVGSLHGKHAERGVLITTTSFSADALEFVSTIRMNIVLIDGDRLARLMFEHGVGVQEEEPVVLKRVDETFFERI